MWSEALPQWHLHARRRLGWAAQQLGYRFLVTHTLTCQGPCVPLANGSCSVSTSHSTILRAGTRGAMQGNG
jgi:hypothetical protein